MRGEIPVENSCRCIAVGNFPSPRMRYLVLLLVYTMSVHSTQPSVQRVRGFCDDALYKSTFYLLTCLLKVTVLAWPVIGPGFKLWSGPVSTLLL